MVDRANGFLPSPITTKMYLINTNHAFPVVFLAFHPFDFYDSATGIYTNFTENWDSPADIIMFNTDREIEFEQPTKVEIHGSANASFAHNSHLLSNRH